MEASTNVLKHQKVLVVYPNRASFITKDIEMLSGTYTVVEYLFKTPSKAWVPFRLISQFFILLFTIKRYTAIFCEFGGYHSFIPALLGKLFGIKCIVIPCGADCVAYESTNYGNLRKPLYRWFTLTSYKLAAYICPVHAALAFYNNTYYSVDRDAQGIKAFLPKLETPIIPIENGYDVQKWYNKDRPGKITFLTVAGFLKDSYRRVLKGVDMVEQLAAIYPEYEFVIIGSDTSKDYLTDPPNLKRIGFVPNNELINYYHQATFYLQLSLSEGFPNALSEAMACGCVPVVSNVSSMPFIVGDTGFVLQERNIDKLKDLIDVAIKADLKALSANAHRKIATDYPEERRKQALIDIIARA